MIRSLALPACVRSRRAEYTPTAWGPQ